MKTIDSIVKSVLASPAVIETSNGFGGSSFAPFDFALMLVAMKNGIDKLIPTDAGKSKKGEKKTALLPETLRAQASIQCNADDRKALSRLKKDDKITGRARLAFNESLMIKDLGLTPAHKKALQAQARKNIGACDKLRLSRVTKVVQRKGAQSDISFGRAQ
jgi:hypothetical protein